MSYQVCGHCDRLLCDKTLKEHRRVYFDNGAWIRCHGDDHEVDSRSSSPLCVSAPVSGDHQLSSHSSLEPDQLQLNESMSSDDEFADFTNSPDKECPSKSCMGSALGYVCTGISV